jgi:hypothetical protein
MKLFEATHTFFYNWTQVSAANWRKYPNDNCPHVVAIDVLDRRVDPETGILRTERLITCHQTIPGMLNRLCGGCTISYAREVSEIDPQNKVLKMTSCNLSMNHLINVTETVTYTEDPTNSSRTLFKQEARIKCGESISRFAGYIENFFIQRFRDNAAQGRQGFENILMVQGETVS